MNSNEPSLPSGKQVLVGLIGGIASGKSTVAQILSDRGALVIDADQLGHLVLKSPETIRKLVEAFGDPILDSNGSIDRSRLGKLVFGRSTESKGNRTRLEMIVHPRIRRLVEEIITQEGSKKDGKRILVLDAPLLLEAGWKDLCDWIVFVETPIALRIEWAGRRGWSEEELLLREEAQLPLSQKAAQSNFVLHNHGNWESLMVQIESLWALLTNPLPSQ